MYDDILGPREEEIEIKPKKKTGKKTLKAKKRTTLKANLAPSVRQPVAIDDDDDELCSECGQDWEDCECEDIHDLEMDDGPDEAKPSAKDPWQDVGKEPCDEAEEELPELDLSDLEEILEEDDCDACDGCDSALKSIAVNLKEDPCVDCHQNLKDDCNGECHKCNEDCMFTFLV